MRILEPDTWTAMQCVAVAVLAVALGAAAVIGFLAAKGTRGTTRICWMVAAAGLCALAFIGVRAFVLDQSL